MSLTSFLDTILLWPKSVFEYVLWLVLLAIVYSYILNKIFNRFLEEPNEDLINKISAAMAIFWPATFKATVIAAVVYSLLEILRNEVKKSTKSIKNITNTGSSEIQ